MGVWSLAALIYMYMYIVHVMYIVCVHCTSYMCMNYKECMCSNQLIHQFTSSVSLHKCITENMPKFIYSLCTCVTLCHDLPCIHVHVASTRSLSELSSALPSDGATLRDRYLERTPSPPHSSPPSPSPTSFRPVRKKL